jgi:transmembrane sensor
MSDMRHPDDINSIESAAAEWVIRLKGVVPAQGANAEFDRWRRRSPLHAQAFLTAHKTWKDLAILQIHPGPLAADLARLSGRRQPTDAPAFVAPRARLSGLRASLGALCLAGLTGFSIFWYGSPITLLAADYRSALGEQRMVQLSDGSRVELGSKSAITLHFDGRERRVELLEGAAYFIVAPMGDAEKRPFVVEGASGTATALGTEFSVERLADAVEVTVTQHDVRVEYAAPDHAASQVVVSAGQSVRYAPDMGLAAVTERNVEQATAWRRGRLVFNEVALSDVVAELNRYRRGRIVISDSELAKKKVSGLFRTDDLDNALATITRELGLRQVSAPPFLTIIF